MELLDHADSRRYSELREQLAEKDKVAKTMSNRIKEVQADLNDTRSLLEASRKQSAGLHRALATAQAQVNAAGGGRSYGVGDGVGAGPSSKTTGIPRSKTKSKVSARRTRRGYTVALIDSLPLPLRMKMGLAMGGGMASTYGHRTPSMYRASRMSRAPSSSDAERRDGGRDDEDEESPKQRGRQRDRTPSKSSQDGDSDNRARHRAAAATQESGEANESVEAVNASMPPPTSSSILGRSSDTRKTRRSQRNGGETASFSASTAGESASIDISTVGRSGRSQAEAESTPMDGDVGGMGQGGHGESTGRAGSANSNKSEVMKGKKKVSKA